MAIEKSSQRELAIQARPAFFHIPHFSHVLRRPDLHQPYFTGYMVILDIRSRPLLVAVSRVLTRQCSSYSHLRLGEMGDEITKGTR